MQQTLRRWVEAQCLGSWLSAVEQAKKQADEALQDAEEQEKEAMAKSQAAIADAQVDLCVAK